MARALIVEDEPTIRHLTAEYLEDAGFEVHEVGDSEDGLALLSSDRDWDVLFADIVMPGELDGWELAQLAKLLVPNLYVIYASGVVGRVSHLTEREAFLEKPYFFEDVQRALDSLRPHLLH